MVAKLLYSVTMFLDGFIAGPGGDMSWLTAYLGPNPEVSALIGEIGALIVGNKTFGGDDPHRGNVEKEGKAFGGGWDGPQFVLTHNPPNTQVPGVTFVDDFRTAIDLAMRAAGDKYVNILGADVARQCFAADLVDEVFVFVAPIMLGGGVRVFEQSSGRPVKLERIGLTGAPLATNIRLRVVTD